MSCERTVLRGGFGTDNVTRTWRRGRHIFTTARSTACFRDVSMVNSVALSLQLTSRLQVRRARCGHQGALRTKRVSGETVVAQFGNHMLVPVLSQFQQVRWRRPISMAIGRTSWPWTISSPALVGCYSRVGCERMQHLSTTSPVVQPIVLGPEWSSTCRRGVFECRRYLRRYFL